MATIIRFPLAPSPARTAAVAAQHSLDPRTFRARLQAQDRAIVRAGGPALSPQDCRFIADCKAGRITPGDIRGHTTRAALARRIIRHLNRHGHDDHLRG